MAAASAERDPGCEEVARYLDAYVDGEFLVEERGEFERHLAACPTCAKKARAQAGFKAALKAAAPRPPVPGALRDRLGIALAHQRQDGEEPRWRTAATRLAPAAAAALALTALIGSSHHFSPVADEAIQNHRRDLPMEIAGSPEQVRDWFLQKVDFAVRPPTLPSATLIGARLTHIRDHQAAYLVYNVGGNRVSVFLFDPSGLSIDARRHRESGGREIFLDDQRGYHVALGRNGGLGYAFASSDLDEDRMFQLASATLTR